jgi:hypothetical protein
MIYENSKLDPVYNSGEYWVNVDVGFLTSHNSGVTT